jgi:formylmethanofuran dehydrogenase subunit C
MTQYNGGIVMRGGLFIIVCPFGHCIASFGIVMRGGLFIIVCPFEQTTQSRYRMTQYNGQKDKQ